MKLVLAEKPSVAQSIAKVLGAAKREDGYLEGNGYVVSWCVGHLVELAQPEVYDAKYSKWAYADLPIFPMDWQYEVSAGTKPANKNQVLFEKNFFLKKSITNKPAFFIWFNKTDMSLFLLIYFHYSGIVYSQKFIKSCDLCNLTWLSFFHFLLNEVINSIVFWFQSSHTSHCFKSNFS